MASTPTPILDEMKNATDSGKLSDAFKLLMEHDKAEEEGFIRRLGEESTQLRAVIEKKEQTVEEIRSAFSIFNPVAFTGHDVLLEMQMKDRRKLDLLAQLLLLSRESLKEKDQHLESIEEAESSDDEE